MDSRASPPPIARRLIRALAPARLRDQIDDDLAENFARRRDHDGPRAARLWYWRQLLSADVLRLWRPPRLHRTGEQPRTGNMMIADLVADLRFALRALRNHPTYTVVVVVTLALGIGLNTAVFTVVNAVLLRPLPYDDAERLAMVFRTVPRLGFNRSVASYPDFLDWKQQADSFAELAAYAYDSATYAGTDGAEQWEGYRVTAGLFPMLGVTPQLGRPFSEAEDRPGAAGVVVLSHDTWQSRFGADPGVVGDTVQLDDEQLLVIAIMPPGFAFPSQGADYWVPLRGDAERMARDTNFLTVIGRLAPDVSVAQAQTEMEEITARIDAGAAGANEGYGVLVEGRHGFVVRNARTALAVFSGAVAMILAIACANVANLMLLRGTRRRGELALRAALGAGRHRLARLMLAESTLLAIGGGTLGLALCWGLVRVLLALDPDRLPRTAEIAVDGTTLAFTAVVALGCGILFGAAPALLGSRAGLRTPLQASSAGSVTGRLSRGMQRSFVVVQVALAMVLLVGSALLLNSFVRLVSVQPGFDPDNVIAARVAPVSPPMPANASESEMEAFFERVTAERRRLFTQLLDRAKALPGVESAGLSYRLPFGRHSFSRIVVAEGMETAEGEAPVIAGNIIEGDYLDTMGIALKRGRGFTADDAAGTPPVVLVNESMADRFWPQQGAVGRRVRFGSGDGPWATVVGVVADTRVDSLEEPPAPLYYRPLAQVGWPDGMFVAVRSTTPPEELVGALRRQVWSLDPRLPLTDVTTAAALLHTSVATPRFRTAVLSAFGIMAVLLAVVGLYGVVAHAVSDRTREIGIRRALGADDGRVLGMVFRGGLGLTAIGIGFGALAALALTRYLSAMLFAVAPTDLLTFVAVASTLAGAAGFACWLPARRAVRVDPVSALRTD